MAYSGPCYSPSRGGTQDAQRCMRLYDYKQRWEEPRGWSADIAMGNVLHAGLAAHYSGKPPSQAIYDSLDKEWSGEGKEEAEVVALRCLSDALALDILGKTGKVLAVEQAMGPEQCHPDLVIQHSLIDEAPSDLQWLEVVDWKFSYQLKPEWVTKRLASYETSWQLKHYAWRVQQEFGLPCTKVTVVQMAATPKPKAWSQSFEITQESLAAWEASAVVWWKQMNAIDLFGSAPQNYEGCRKYGENHLCPFYQGCHTLHGNEEKFDTLYKRKV